MSKYKWAGYSHDTAYQVSSEKLFDSEEECYNDMRNAALEKMKWNTEYSEDYNDTDDAVTYKVYFNTWMIAHSSYSGVYVYLILNEYESAEYCDVFSDTVVGILSDYDIANSRDIDQIKENKRPYLYGRKWDIVKLDDIEHALACDHSVYNGEASAEWRHVLQLPEGAVYMDNVCGEMLIMLDGSHGYATKF